MSAARVHAPGPEVAAHQQEPARSPTGRRSRAHAAGPRGPATRPAEPATQRGAAIQPTAIEEVEVIDLVNSPDDTIEIVSSTVAPEPPRKRQRLSPHKQALLLQAQAAAAAAAAAPPRPPDSPKGPSCGICLESMGGSTGRPMWAGTCGHVYCKDCLIEAIRATKRCPTCRKNLQVRQLHPVFVNFS